MRSVLCWLLLSLPGCTVGPDFTAPHSQVPVQWSSSPATPCSAAEDAELASWWAVFQDATLTSLVERALASNLDLQLAAARIRQARAARGVAAAGFGPTLQAAAEFQRRRSSSEVRGSPTVNQYQAGFDAGWEIDIFGAVRRAVEAADADIAAATESRRDLWVSLAGEVAVTYVDLRTLQRRIAIAQRNLDAQRHSVALTRQRFEAGFASRLDVVNAAAQAAATAAQVPLLEDAARQAIHAIGVLLGAEPGALTHELATEGTIPEALPSLAMGIPSELLRRRPDIRRAEAEIHAATARIGVASAELFPRLSIGGSVGVQANTPQNLWEPFSRFWSLGPSVSWPLFTMGRTRAAVEVQQALQEQSLIAYRQVVLSALREVEDALSAARSEQQRHDDLVVAVDSNRQAVELATALYTAGQADFLNVLGAQRALYAAEDALAQNRRALSAQHIALYKALGGGWRGE
jgi:NodT family efflux transporter outer membrane factor (OMF) lipoprotein